MVPIAKEYLNTIEKYSKACIFCFIREDQKKVYVSYTKNLSDYLVRLYKPRSPKPHPEIDYSTWTLLVLEDVDPSCLLEKQYYWYCYFKERDYTTFNREIKYKVIGLIEPDFRKPGQWLYYVWLSSRRYKVRPLGVFEKVKEGEVFLKELQKTNIFIQYSNELTKQFIDSVEDLEYDRFIKRIKN